MGEPVRGASAYHAAPVTGLVLLTGAVTDKLVDFATNLIGDAGYAGVVPSTRRLTAAVPGDDEVETNTDDDADNEQEPAAAARRP